MAFAVYWPLPIENHYALAWMMAADQPAVVAARQGIDRLLSADPHSHGRHLAEGLWKISVPPLLVHFDIDTPAGVVNVTQLDLVT
jgi:pimeloyl-ACP methyl ester carboxylesterase